MNLGNNEFMTEIAIFLTKTYVVFLAEGHIHNMALLQYASNYRCIKLSVCRPTVVQKSYMH